MTWSLKSHTASTSPRSYPLSTSVDVIELSREVEFLLSPLIILGPSPFDRTCLDIENKTQVKCKSAKQRRTEDRRQMILMAVENTLHDKQSHKIPTTKRAIALSPWNAERASRMFARRFQSERRVVAEYKMKTTNSALIIWSVKTTPLTVAAVSARELKSMPVERRTTTIIVV